MSDSLKWGLFDSLHEEIIVLLGFALLTLGSLFLLFPQILLRHLCVRRQPLCDILVVVEPNGRNGLFAHTQDLADFGFSATHFEQETPVLFIFLVRLFLVLFATGQATLFLVV